MSECVVRMEMPTNCDECPFLDYEEGFCLASGVKHESGWYESTLCPGSIKDGRHYECPLVPVPPHGRLIDADALKDYLIAEAASYDLTQGQMGILSEAIYMIDEQPTIVPAERSET